MFFTKYIYKLHTHIYMYEKDLVLDNREWLICHQTKPNKISQNFLSKTKPQQKYFEQDGSAVKVIFFFSYYVTFVIRVQVSLETISFVKNFCTLRVFCLFVLFCFSNFNPPGSSRCCSRPFYQLLLN